jgi:hypothetical protein
MKLKLKESNMNDVVELGSIVTETKFRGVGNLKDHLFIPTKVPG